MKLNPIKLDGVWNEGYALDYYASGTIILNGREIKAICTQNASPIAFIVDRKETLEAEVLS